MNSKKHATLSTKVKKNNVNEDISSNKKLLVKCLNKKCFIYFLLLLFDVILVIYSAKNNVVNYVTIAGEDIFVSKTRYLLVGRNYITLIIITFFYGYICLMKRFFLHEKLTKRYLTLLFVILVILNFSLFFIFTERIY